MLWGGVGWGLKYVHDRPSDVGLGSTNTNNVDAVDSIFEFKPPALRSGLNLTELPLHPLRKSSISLEGITSCCIVDRFNARVFTFASKTFFYFFSFKFLLSSFYTLFIPSNFFCYAFDGFRSSSFFSFTLFCSVFLLFFFFDKKNIIYIEVVHVFVVNPIEISS